MAPTKGINRPQTRIGISCIQVHHCFQSGSSKVTCAHLLGATVYAATNCSPNQLCSHGTMMKKSKALYTPTCAACQVMMCALEDEEGHGGEGCSSQGDGKWPRNGLSRKFLWRQMAFSHNSRSSAPLVKHFIINARFVTGISNICYFM